MRAGLFWTRHNKRMEDPESAQRFQEVLARIRAYDQTAAIEQLLAEHILLGYGECSCGVTFATPGRYSRGHRRHLAVLVHARFLSEADR